MDCEKMQTLPVKELIIVSASKEHGFNSFAEARKWAKENIVGSVQQPEIGEVNISRTAIDKYLSQKAVDKSDSKDVHLSALKVLPQVIENSFVIVIHDDRDGNTNLRDVIRLFGAIKIDDRIFRVKTTVKRYNDNNVKSKAYSYEVTEIELLDGQHGETHTIGADFSPRNSNNSISAANLLQIIKSDNKN